MTSSPRFLRHPYDGLELRSDLPFTTIATTVINYFHRRDRDEMDNEYYPRNYQRGLAGGGESFSVSYTIFSVAVLTLGLLMITEVILHTLDHYAKERKFFRQVLNTFYRECKFNFPATLKDLLNFLANLISPLVYFTVQWRYLELWNGLFLSFTCIILPLIQTKSCFLLEYISCCFTQLSSTLYNVPFYTTVVRDKQGNGGCRLKI